MKTQNCTIYEHSLFWCILMIRFAWLVKFYGILVAMHQQRNTQRLTGRNTQRLNWQFGKLQNLLQWERAQGHLPELIFWFFIVLQIIIIEPRSDNWNISQILWHWLCNRLDLQSDAKNSWSVRNSWQRAFFGSKNIVKARGVCLWRCNNHFSLSIKAIMKITCNSRQICLIWCNS